MTTRFLNNFYLKTKLKMTYKSQMLQVDCEIHYYWIIKVFILEELMSGIEKKFKEIRFDNARYNKKSHYIILEFFKRIK